MNNLSENELNIYITGIDYRQTKNKTLVRIYGRDENAIPVRLELDDFLPYLFIQLTDEEKLMQYIQQHTENSQLIENWLVSTEPVSMIQYDGGKKLDLLKIIGKFPGLVTKIRNILTEQGFKHYESDLPFVKRFLINTSIRCLNVVHITKVTTHKEKNGGFIFKARTSDIQPSDIDPLKFRRLMHLSFDIEVDDRGVGSIEELEAQERRITAISICWGNHRDTHNSQVFVLKEDSDNAEKQLLKDFFTHFREVQPDIVTGYNTDNFDFPYLIARAKKLGLSTKPLSLLGDDEVRRSGRIRTHVMKGRIHCDLYSEVGNNIITESGRRGLNDVSKTLLGEAKITHQESLGELWAKGVLENDQHSLNTFLRYSETDAILSYKLFYALQVENKLELIRITGFAPNSGIKASERNIGELELMRKCYQRGVLIPNSASDEEYLRRKEKGEAESLKGGKVIDPKGTYLSDVIILDFRSLYPSLIISYNIGGETILSYDSYEFNQETKSVLAEMEEYLLSYRFRLKQQKKELQKELLEMSREKLEDTEIYRRRQEELEYVDRRQATLKLVANALYGAAGSPYGRFYVLHIASAITALGRKHLTSLFDHIAQFNELYGTHYDIVYGDTDSVFVKVDDSNQFEQLYNLTMQAKKGDVSPHKVKIIEQDVYNMVNQLLNYINDKLPKDMKLELEDIAYRIIFQPDRKKAYGYVSAFSGELNIRGFEAVRGDWTPFSKRVQLNVIDILLRSGDLQAAMEDAKKVVRHECRILLTKSLEKLQDEIILHAPINQPPSKYKQAQPVLGAFLNYCEVHGLDPETEWKNISKFPYLIFKGKGPQYLRSRHPDLLDGREIDRNQYIKQLLGAVSRFGVNIQIDEIKYNTRKTTLFEFV